MKGTILVTDTLFIFPEHEALLRSSGYEVEGWCTSCKLRVHGWN